MTTETRPTSGVSRTAVIIAQARATEHAREDRLFSDPYAQAFVDAVGWIQVAEAGRLNQGHFVLRTRFFDDYFRTAAAAGVRQAVLVAAGLDTRAFRLEWPSGFRLFEIDLPGLLAFKEAVLGVHRARPACDRTTVRADLRDDWPSALLSAGFDPERPTAWLIEGLMMYLTHAENDRLLHAIGTLSAPGSHLALEHINQAYTELPELRAVHSRLRRVGADWRSTVEDPCGWLAGHGWTATTTPQSTLATTHNRPVPPLTDPTRVGPARMWLTTATRTP
ncbi:SAM-dependent methyltransferase [Streptomyces sp. TRM64462]|uniref:SAM-dependent methyltransferase n=1 Tax=Streptomyces sp. TRM64462 TaxID=2741726 RepID=UPI001586F7CD|nr:SAM-dependent methyltransferase [Streptomyces sp. TRM64462]